MRAGMLRHRGMLQQRSKSRDGVGGQSLAWIDIAPVRFAIEGLGGHESDIAGAVRPQSNYTITMRYRSGVDSKMRIVGLHSLLGRVFNFTNINDTEERHRQLVISAIEGQSPPPAGLTPPV